MNKIFKRLLVCTLALLMVVNPLGACFALEASGGGAGGASSDIEIEVSEVTGLTYTNHDDVINKLEFKVTSKNPIQVFTTSFSYDNTVVQPMHKDLNRKANFEVEVDFVSKAGNSLLSIPQYTLDGDNWGPSDLVSTVAEKENRTAINFGVTNTSGAAFDASSETVVFEFYFKYKDGKTPNSDTFKIETNSSEDGILADIYPTGNEKFRSGIRVDWLNDEEKTETSYYANNSLLTSTIAAPTLTYTGSDKLVLKTVEIDDSTIDSITAPVLLPEPGADVTYTFTATATSTTGVDMTNDVTFVWALDGEYSDKIVLDASTGKLTVKAGAEETEVKVTVTADGKTDSASLFVKRLTDAADYIVTTVDGTEAADAISVIAPVKDSETNTYEFKTTGKTAYGDDITETYTYAITGTDSSLISIADGVLTVAKGAEEIKGAAVTVSDSKGVVKTIALNISSIVVDWSGVKAVEKKVYGAKNSELVEIPAEGVAKIGDDVVAEGTFSVVNPDEVQGANEETGIDRFVTVNFVVADGDYAGTYSTDVAVNIGKAEIDVAAFEATLTNKTEKYTGEAIAYTYDKAKVPAGLDVSVGYILADSAANDPVTALPVEIGEHKAVITYALTGKDQFVPANFKIPVEVRKNLTITKAELVKIGEVKDVTKTAYEVKEVTEAAAFVNLLPIEVDAYYTAEKAEAVEVEWKTTDSYDAKGKTYTFTGTLTAGELVECEGETITAKVIVTPSEVTATALLGTVTLAKKSVADAITFADINEGLKLSFSEWTDAQYVSADKVTFDKTLEAVKAEAAAIAEEGTIKVKATALPAEYAWATVTLPEFTLNITAKYVATVTAELSADSIVYGEALPTVAAKAETQAGDPIADAKFNCEYYAEDGTKLTAAPKNAGKYTVVAVLDNEEYAGSSESLAFTIAPKKATFTIKDISKTYGDVWPAAEGAFKENDILEGDTVEVKLSTEKLDKFADVGSKVEVEATYDNKNYDVTIVQGTYEITKKSLNKLKAPVVKGDIEVGSTITTEEYVINEDPDFDTEVGRIWFVKVEGNWQPVDLTSDYTDFSFDITPSYSNATMGVAVIAKEGAVNYEGQTDVAEFTVPKCDLASDITVKLPDDEISIDDELEVSLEAISGGGGVISPEDVKYEWKVGDEIAGTEAKFTIKEGMSGIVSVTVSLAETASYTGSWTKVVGEIGKTQITKLVEAITAELNAEKTEFTATITPDTLTDEQKANFEIKWFREGVEIEGATGEKYTVTKADLGKKISAKVVAKADSSYTGEVVAAGDVVPAQKPVITEVKETITKDSITLTITVEENGDAVRFVNVDYTEVVGEGEKVSNEGAQTVYKEEGKFVFALEDLGEGETYKFTITAENMAGESEAVVKEFKTSVTSSGIINTGGNKKPSSSKPSGGTTTPTTPSAPTEAVVESSKPSATVDSKALEGKETVAATVKTESGTEVKMEADIKDANVASLTVEAAKADVAIAEAVKETVVEVIEVKVEAKDASKNDVDVKVDVAIPSEEKAYAYEVDAFGNLIRVESEYDAEAGEVKVADVADGTVLAVSTTEPKDFADTTGRWSEAEINKAADRGIVNGKGDGFDPVGNLTRHESNVLYKNLVDAVKATLDKKADAKVDTHEEHWGHDSDVWAVEVGISTGVGVNDEGEVIMNGSANITRQDFATLAARVLGLVVGEVKVEGEAKAFVDGAELPEYAKAAVDMLSGLGIINGSEANGGFKFSGAANITREEAAAITNRIYEFVAASLVK